MCGFDCLLRIFLNLSSFFKPEYFENYFVFFLFFRLQKKNTKLYSVESLLAGFI
jgi:hypothetical protein